MKFWKKFAKSLTSPFMVGMVVTFASIYFSMAYYSARDRGLSKEKSILGKLNEIHEKSIDWRLLDRGSAPGSDQVAVLAIDDHSLDLEGRWPWPRDKQAKLIDKALFYGAKSISFDIVYSEEDNNSALPTLNRVILAKGPNDKLPASVEQQIQDEFSRADLDKIYGNTIEAGRDQLILGSFFSFEQNPFDYNPVADICIDGMFNRSAAGKYWNKEAGAVTMIDDYQSKHVVPPNMMTGLATYMNELEFRAADQYFFDNPNRLKDIETALHSMAKDFDPAIYPLIAVMALNDDKARAKETFAQIDPMYGDEEIVTKLFDRLLFGLGSVEKARLAAKLREANLDYCGRFMTSRDELLTWEQYKKIWTDEKTPEDQLASAQENFNSMKWTAVLGLDKKEEGRNPSSMPQELTDIVTSAMRNRVITQIDWAVNIPLLAKATKQTGYFNARLDSDGAVRRTRLTVRTGNHYMPSLALRTFLTNNEATAVGRLAVEKLGREEPTKVLKGIEVKDAKGTTILTLPTDYEGQMTINYAGAQHMFPHVSAADILNDAPTMKIHVREQDPVTKLWVEDEKVVNKKEFMKDKQFVLGATAVGVYDLRVTPFDENFPGVETHANVLSNMLIELARARGEKIDPRSPGFMHAHPNEGFWMVIILLGMGIILSGLLSYLGAVSGLGVTAAFLAAIYAFDKYYFFQSGIITTVLFPVSLVSGNYVSLTFYKYFTEERKKQALKGTFAKYVSPAIVDEILADPENIELGGKKMDLTVMFSDVRGFTTISEKLDPRALSDFLNSYLTPMTNIVFENKGTLDKYIGDAIMAFWGAPIHFQDHAHHACRCALKMLEKLKELQAGYERDGLPPIDIGIGLNSGDMSVGNMGSDTVRSYTVMGDNVNLGSRLEGITKKYGTRIIISESTYNHVKDSFYCREVDWVRVKGKTKPVKIYEVVAEGQPLEPKATLMKHYEEGYRLYRERKFAEAVDAFKRAHNHDPNDDLSVKYIELCEEYVVEPPPADWDGVSNMKEK